MRTSWIGFASIPVASALLTGKCHHHAIMYPSQLQRSATTAIAKRRRCIHRDFVSPANDLPGEVEEGKTFAVVGGGLAGLSVAYHLLEKTQSAIQLTIIDKANPGEGGASSVAGGLLHPFSPRGKLVHLGKQGLECSARLIRIAQRFEPDCILRDRLYRVALSERNVEQLTKTANMYPELATWLGPEDIEKVCGARSLGGIAMTNGCKVICVPKYLKGLWRACKELSDDKAQWVIEQNAAVDWKDRLADFDTVIFAAGSGMFQDSILLQDAKDFPAVMVRGQSIEMTVPASLKDSSNEAVLCGKYIAPISPMIENDQLLIGATHEYKSEALSEQEVWDELKGRSYELSPVLWEQGNLSRITSGYRVQSKRGKYGRMPIIGRSCGDLHDNAWLFTGLSSRGLIYHGVYGNILSDAIIAGSEESMLELHPDLAWWKKR